MRAALSVLALLATLAGSPVRAETPLSASEFEAYTTGKTLTYAAEGRIYGIEEYRTGRRVRWSFLDGECQEGTWYASGEMICFAYESGLEDQCWLFFRDPGGLRARFMNRPGDDDLIETRQSDDPLLCLGPRIGA